MKNAVIRRSNHYQEFRPHGQSVDLLKKLNFDLMKFDLLTLSLCNSKVKFHNALDLILILRLLTESVRFSALYPEHHVVFFGAKNVTIPNTSLKFSLCYFKITKIQQFLKKTRLIFMFLSTVKILLYCLLRKIITNFMAYY